MKPVNKLLEVIQKEGRPHPIVVKYLRDKLLSSTSSNHLEIELRLGNHVFDPELPPKFVEESLKRQLVLHAKSKQSSVATLAKEFAEHSVFFRPDLSLQRLVAMEKFCVSSMLEKKTDVHLDVVFRGGGGKRMTWDVQSGEIFENTKLLKENVDLLHQGQFYRLSTALEKVKQMQREEVEELFNTAASTEHATRKDTPSGLNSWTFP